MFEFERFEKVPVIDCHMHFENIRKVSQMLEVFSKANFHRVNVLSLTNTRINSARGIPNLNPEVLALKALHPEIFYAFGSLDYFPFFKGNKKPSFSEQVDKMEKVGFDGVKMVEGKPSEKKFLGVRFDDKTFEDYFKILEEKQLTLLFHVADPEEFWDPEKVPSWAKEQGWFYDSTYPSKQQLYEEVGNVLDKHKNLKVIFAHFYFLSSDINSASKLFDNYKNVHLDITPGIEMYYNFSKKRNSWREFFIKYQDRILFGTDIGDWQDVNSALARAWFVRNFLESSSEFYLPSEADSLLEPQTKKSIFGLNLPRAVLEKIYYENFVKLVGSKPKKLSIDLAVEECERLAKEEALIENKPLEKTNAYVAIRTIKEATNFY
ncbi:MAG: amidohydrolase family protein [Thermoproteota archaeon]